MHTMTAMDFGTNINAKPHGEETLRKLMNEPEEPVPITPVVPDESESETDPDVPIIRPTIEPEVDPTPTEPSEESQASEDEPSASEDEPTASEDEPTASEDEPAPSEEDESESESA